MVIKTRNSYFQKNAIVIFPPIDKGSSKKKSIYWKNKMEQEENDLLDTILRNYFIGLNQDETWSRFQDVWRNRLTFNIRNDLMDFTNDPQALRINCIRILDMKA